MSLIASTLAAAAGNRTPTWRAFDNITNATFDNITDLINNVDSVPSGIFVREDVPRLYMCGSNSDSISEYSFMGDVWDVGGGLYRESGSSSLNGQDTVLQDFSFSPDGTKLFTIGSTNGNIYSYTLTIPWDLSTITYDGVSVSTGTETVPTGLFVKPDGTRLWFTGQITDVVYQWDLVSPWNLDGTPSQTGTNVAGDTIPYGVTFSSDGTKMYITGDASNNIDQFNLTTPWDISDSLSVVSFKNVNTEVAQPQSTAFNPDGTKMYVVGSSELNQYTSG